MTCGPYSRGDAAIARWIIAALLAATCAACTPSHASSAPSTPSVWMIPPSHENGRCFRQPYEHADQWTEVRSRVRVLAYADHQLNRQFTDAELGARA